MKKQNLRFDLKEDSDSEEGSERTVESEQEDNISIDGLIRRSFKKCECIHFVPSRSSSEECECGRKQEQHNLEQHLDDDDQKHASWSPHTDTKKSPTDAFGEIEFPARFTINRAKFIRLAYDTSPSLILDLLVYKWRLDLPQLVISVIGGERDFSLPLALQKHFSAGLVKAASTAGAWILTPGTNFGVTKVVGKAIEIYNSSSQDRISAIGITAWGAVENREIIRKTRVAPYSKSTAYSQYSVQLENNHSHFILVDDGTVQKVGAEVKLRGHLEAYIAQENLPGTQCNIPIVLLLLEGQADTIKKVLSGLCQEPPATPFPVVIVEGSGGASDLLAFAYKHSDSKGFISKYERKLAKAINQYFGTLDEAEKSQILKDVVECMNYKNFITVQSFDRIGSNDIDVSILSTILRVTLMDNDGDGGDYPLHLAIAWDRVDLAKDIFAHGATIEEFTLHSLMFEVLKKNQVDFVKLIIEQGLNVKKFLTVEKLNNLYNCSNIEEKEKSPTLLHMLYVSKFNLKEIEVFNLCHVGFIIEMLMGGNFTSPYRTFYLSDSGSTNNLSDFRYRHSKLQDLIELSSLNSKPRDLSEKVFVDPYVELMIWSILTKRHQLALFFCQQSRQAVAKALNASALYMGMAKVAHSSYDEDGALELTQQAEMFRDLAVDLLEACYNSDPLMTHRLCLSVLPDWNNLTLIGVAEAVQNYKFISHPACQNLLTNVWLGYFAVGRHSILDPLLIMLSGVFPPILLTLDYRNQIGGTEVDMVFKETFPKKDKGKDGDVNKTDQQNKRRIISMQSMMEKKTENISPNKITSLSTLEKFQAFYSAPSSSFWRNLFAYIIFLICFTLVVLTNPRGDQWKDWGIKYLDTLCFVFVLSLLVEELRQIICQKNACNFVWKFKLWARETWSLVNMVAILLFLLGWVLRISPHYVDAYYYGRVSYALSSVFFYLRILEFFKMSEYYGTMINMIGIMRRDTIFFCVILLVYMLAYGVSTTAILYPFTQISESTLYSVFFVPYWQFYGELFLENRGPNFCESKTNEAGRLISEMCSFEPNLTSDYCDENDCEAVEACHPNCHLGQYMVPLMMALYLILSNILLLNMLIAIYSNIFAQVQENSSTIWKYERYKLIAKYTEMPPAIPPFILIYHLYLILNWVASKVTGKPYKTRGIPNLLLSGNDLENMCMFEMSCVDSYCREKNNLFIQQTDQRIKSLSEKMDSLLLAEQYEQALEANEKGEDAEGSGEALAAADVVSETGTAIEVEARLDRVESMMQKILDITMKLQEEKKT